MIFDPLSHNLGMDNNPELKQIRVQQPKESSSPKRVKALSLSLAARDNSMIPYFSSPLYHVHPITSRWYKAPGELRFAHMLAPRCNMRLLVREGRPTPYQPFILFLVGPSASVYRFRLWRSLKTYRARRNNTAWLRRLGLNLQFLLLGFCSLSTCLGLSSDSPALTLAMPPIVC